MVKVLRGVVHGRTIELDAEPGIEDGRTVEVIVRSKSLPGPPPGWRPGGNETAAGMMAEHWTEEDDRLLEAIERAPSALDTGDPGGSYLLDTNILSAHLRRPAGLTHRFVQHSGRLYTSSVSLAELYDWANGRSDPTPTLAAVQNLLTYEVNVIPFDADCAEDFGRLRVALRRMGLSVDNMDLLIAVTARVYDLTLVTHNTRHFQGIPDLRLEDWLTP